MFGPYQPQEVKLLLADLTPLERERLWKLAYGRAWGSWQAWVGVVVAGLFAFLAMILLPAMPHGLLGYHLRGVAIAMAAGFGAFIGGRVRAYAALPHLRRELASIGRCPGCGYDLAETPQRCPECGRGKD